MMSKTESETLSITMRKRSWIEWVGWAVWLIGIVLLVQNAVASHQELEPRAALIFWISLGVWLLAGLVIWFVRSRR